MKFHSYSYRILALTVLGVGAFTSIFANPISIWAENVVTPITPITPSPTITPPLTPITPTEPTPTIPVSPSTPINQPPVYKTNKLRPTKVEAYYMQTIKIIDREGDEVNVEIQGLPEGLFVLQCVSNKNFRKNTVECEIRGSATKTGQYTVSTTSTDSRGLATSKQYSLTVVRSSR